MSVKLLDCTLRDGGYYNNWDFSQSFIESYLEAMEGISVDFVELGFRSFKNHTYRGCCAYTTDDFINTLQIPASLRIGVMVDAAELLSYPEGINAAIHKLFQQSDNSRVELVRIACHIHEFEAALAAVVPLKELGYIVGYNLMQVADRSYEDLVNIATLASKHPIDVLYFADSMGSLDSGATKSIIDGFQEGWNGEIGIHTHDNMGLALSNTKVAIESGVTWVDSTVTGMGRGPGNAMTEYLVLELLSLREKPVNSIPLLKIIKTNFDPLKNHYKWGTNPYYFLSGKFSIHPSFVQHMLSDSRYADEDILSIISFLKEQGGKKFDVGVLDVAKNFYKGEPKSSWNPKSIFKGRDVLIIGSGNKTVTHKSEIELFIKAKRPIVMALNTSSSVQESLVDIRVASHPVRLMADCSKHNRLPQPLITPKSMLPESVVEELKGKTVYDFGIEIKANEFHFSDMFATIPSSLVIAYALAVATGGDANKIYLAGFDGYGADDPRHLESDLIFTQYVQREGALPMVSITPTTYNIRTASIYSLD